MATDIGVESYIPKNRPIEALSVLHRLERLACRAEATLKHHSVGCAATLSAVYLGIILPLSRIRPLWFDELITLYVCRFRSITDLWAALQTGAELNPPMFHLVIRGSELLLGENSVALRVPSIVSYWIMSLALYLFARKRMSPIFALIVALFPLVTVASFYSCEARPYAMILACSASLLLFWREASENGRQRRIALAAMALTLAFAVSSHYYAAFIALPVVAGEGVRYLERRKPDWSMWVAIAAGLAVELCFLPLIRAGLHIQKSPTVWCRPQLDFLWTSYRNLLRAGLLPVCVTLGLLLVRWGTRSTSAPKYHSLLPKRELAACVALALLPVLGYCVARGITGLLTERYVLETIIGISILFGVGAARLSHGRRSIGLALLLAIITCFVVEQAMNVRFYDSLQNRYKRLAAQDTALAYNLPIVQKDTLELLDLLYYAPSEFASRLVYPVDTDLPHRYGEDDSGQKIFAGGTHIFPAHVVTMDSFLRENERFLIYGGPENWIEDYLLRRGANIKIVFQKDGELLLLVTQHPVVKQTPATH